MDISKKRRELTEQDRYLIEKCLHQGYSKAAIARLLCVEPKTIIREVQQGTQEFKDTELRLYSAYSAYYAQIVHNKNTSRRGRKSSHERHCVLIKEIREQLYQGWSPDVIAGRRRHDGEETVCAKTIYNWIELGYIDGFTHERKPRKAAMRKVGYKNPTAKRIDERPQEANERQPNHWEMDLVVSGKNGKGCLLVLTERARRLELIFLLKDKTQASVKAAIDRLERRYKGKFKEKFKTITCDNGSEFLDSFGLEQSCIGQGQRTAVYYAHPYSSWERGSNENANRLIRKFIPKGTDISTLPVAYVKRIEKWINNYPRRIFGYDSANELAND